MQTSNLSQRGFTFVEAVFTIAIIGIMSALAVSAISNGARDANRVVARQQQAAVQSALHAWVLSQTRNSTTGQVQSLQSIRTIYNALPTTSARFNLLLPNPSSADVNARSGFLDQSTADHFLDNTSGTDRLKSAALAGARQHLSLPAWADGDLPRVELLND